MIETQTAEAGSDASPLLAHIRTFETIIRVPGERTANALAVLEHRLPPGALAMPRHSHAAAEALTVLTGELCVEVARKVVVLRAGESLAVPPSIPHTFWVSTDAVEAARVVAVVAPAGIEQYYRDVSRSIQTGGRPDMEAIHAAGELHGVSVELESLYELIERYTLQLS